MENQTGDNEVFNAKLERRFIKNFLDLLILQLVETQPTWGYQIIKETEARYGVKLRHGALYPLLNVLEKKGFILSKKNLHKGRIRKVYEITSRGKELLQAYHKFLQKQSREMST